MKHLNTNIRNGELNSSLEAILQSTKLANKLNDNYLDNLFSTIQIQQDQLNRYIKTARVKSDLKAQCAQMKNIYRELRNLLSAYAQLTNTPFTSPAQRVYAVFSCYVSSINYPQSQLELNSSITALLANLIDEDQVLPSDIALLPCVEKLIERLKAAQKIC
ncbi:MAG: hypothetical protein ACK5JS_07980 [Mangrovibacterium sp.]